MKKFSITLCALLLISQFSCSQSDIVIEDFESDTFKNWTVEGDAFGNGPVSGKIGGQQDIKDFQGQRFANSFHEGDDSRGTLLSPEFTIERNFINFLIGGGMRPDIYVELIIDGKSVLLSRPVVDSETMHWMTWDVKEYKDKQAKIRVVDNQRGPWGHILIDQIEMSNKEKSIMMVDHEIKFNVDQKYLLVPVEDEGPQSSIQIRVNGQNIGPRVDIRVAQTKIDYWVPINVTEYQGKEVSLVFAHVKKTDIGFSQIRPSDSFEYNYNEKYRPSYHFSPQYGWMNDPNGMVYKDGEYHLFFQYNPFGSKWANMSWGHTISKDLKKWEYMPVGIAPDSLGSIFSGSAVIDKDNTAGFGKNAMVAIYTSDGSSQTQCLAYSTDNGRTFTKYDRNPVLSDPAIADFRDPKVFWHAATRQWVMALATSQTITIYGSSNLKDWTKLSEFGEGLGAHGGVWECPDLFPLTYNGQTKWVLFVSINPGGPNGGSATQYFIGNFDGKTFKEDKLPYPVWLDYGRDNYAGVTWSNVPERDGRHIFIGWMSNWDYANHVPTINFRGSATIPRELKLVHNGQHLVVANPPVAEINSLRRNEEKVDNIKVEKTYTIDKILKNNQGAFDIEFTIKPVSAQRFEFKLVNKQGENIRVIFDLDNRKLNVDRSKSGLTDFSSKFADNISESPLVKKSSYKIRLLVDKASTELFVNDGELVQTNLIFPSEPFNSLIFDSVDGTINIENLSAYNMD